MKASLTAADIKKIFSVDIADLKVLDRIVKKTYSRIAKSEEQITKRKQEILEELKGLERAQKSGQKLREAVAKIGAEKAGEVMRNMS